MASYATAADVAERRGAVADEGRCEALLADAAAVMDAEMARCGVDPATVGEGALKAVACAMVGRALGSADLMGATQASRTEGPFSSSYTFGSPAGDLYLSKSDRRLLGTAFSGAGFVQPGV